MFIAKDKRELASGIYCLATVARPPEMSKFHFHLNITRKEKDYKKVKISSDFKGSLLVCNEKGGRMERWQTFAIGLGPWRSRFVCHLILLWFSILIYFRFRQVKLHS
jgi:hypothetical protein